MNRERWASSCRYYSVNANVNTPRDVFRKARISRRLLILVIASTCTSGALNGGEFEGGEADRDGECVRERERKRKRDRYRDGAVKKKRRL